MSPRVLIAASGSGGHLFPAQFIARKLRELYPEVEITFAGSGRPLEEKLIDGAGFTRVVLPLEPLRARGQAALKLPLTFPVAVAATWRMLRETKPDVVIGVGGYVSVLPVLLARLMGIPSWIHEAEARAGKANRLLACVATRISLAFPDAEIPCRSKTVHTGHPLRPEFAAFVAAPQPVPERPQRLLVLGGSQGAEGIDRGLEGLAPWLASRGIEVLHQCRAVNVERLTKAYAASGVAARVQPFIDDMLEACGWAHVIVSRTGAGATMELEVVGKPCVLVPFPHAQGGHQKLNALFLVSKGKGLLCEEGEGFSSRLQAALGQLFDPAEYRRRVSLATDLRSVTAAEAIARGAMALIH